jgi:hypothetical protein
MEQEGNERKGKEKGASQRVDKESGWPQNSHLCGGKTPLSAVFYP